jgi:hypothetical protein
MDDTRISIARVLELGVPISWREAAAVLYEGVCRAQELGGTGMGPVAPGSCLITRGGEIVLGDDAVEAHSHAVAGLAADLLTACDDRGDLGAAVASGHLLPFLDSLAEDTTWKRRRAQIATVALRALAAQADRVLADESETCAAGVAVISNATANPHEGDVAVATSSERGMRQFTRQAPRASSDALRPGSRRPGQRPPRAAAPRAAGVSARLVVWTAVAATGVGIGVWQARAQQPAPRPVVAGPSPVAAYEHGAGSFEPVAMPVVLGLSEAPPPVSRRADPGVAEPPLPVTGDDRGASNGAVPADR